MAPSIYTALVLEGLWHLAYIQPWCWADHHGYFQAGIPSEKFLLSEHPVSHDCVLIEHFIFRRDC